jgi:hypothetical protein
MKKIFVFIGLFLIFFTNVKAEEKISCKTLIDKKFDSLQTDFYEKINAHLKIKNQRQKAKDLSINEIRFLKCELDKICENLEVSFFKQENKKTSSFVCLSLYEKEDERLSLKKYPQCSFNNKLENFREIETYCLNKKNRLIDTSIVLTPNLYLKHSKQDVSNYYAGRIQEITQKLKNLGDIWQQIQNNMKKIFNSIVCLCP